MYVGFVKGRLEAYLLSGGVRALVRSIQWILVGFRCRRRRGTRKTYGLVIRMGHTDCFFLFSILLNVKNEEDADVKVDCSYAFNISEVFVQFVVGIIIILHRCLLMANLI